MGFKLTNKLINHLIQYAKTVDKNPKYKVIDDAYAKMKIDSNTIADKKRINELYEQAEKQYTKILTIDDSLKGVRNNNLLNEYDKEVANICEKYVEFYLQLKEYKDNGKRIQTLMYDFAGIFGFDIEDMDNTKKFFETIENGKPIKADEKKHVFEYNHVYSDTELLKDDSIDVEKYINPGQDNIDDIKNLNARETAFNHSYAETYNKLVDRAIKEREGLQTSSFKADIKGNNKVEIANNTIIKENNYVLEHSFKQILEERNKIQAELDSDSIRRKSDVGTNLRTKINELSMTLGNKKQEAILFIDGRKRAEYQDVVLSSEAIKNEDFTNMTPGQLKNKYYELYKEEINRLKNVDNQIKTYADEFGKVLLETRDNISKFDNSSLFSEQQISEKTQQLEAYNQFIDDYYKKINKQIVEANRYKTDNLDEDYEYETIRSKNKANDDFDKINNDSLKQSQENTKNNVKEFTEAPDRLQQMYNDKVSLIDGLINHEKELKANAKQEMEKRSEKRINNLTKEKQEKAEKEFEDLKKLIDGIDEKVNEKLRKEDEEKEAKKNKKNDNIVIDEKPIKLKYKNGIKLEGVGRDSYLIDYGHHFLKTKKEWDRERNNHTSIYTWAETKKLNLQNEIDRLPAGPERNNAMAELNSFKTSVYLVARKEHDDKGWGWAIFRPISRMIDNARIRKLRKDNINSKEVMEDIYDSMKTSNYLKEHEDKVMTTSMVFEKGEFENKDNPDLTNINVNELDRNIEINTEIDIK